jgi:hypothetical protein
MAEQPKAGRTSVVPAGVQRIRSGLADVRIATKDMLERRGKGGKTSETAEASTPERTSVADGVQHIRTGLADAGVTARRTLERVGWTRVIIVALAQLVIGLIAWRISVRRDRQQQRRVQLWAHDLLKDSPLRRGRRGRTRLT